MLPRLLLNGEPYLHVGVLDQGYWPDGLMTAPSDAAMVHDIATMKRLGFTMLRKHLKVEPLRWYAHCDRLGMLVWQDLVNGGRALPDRGGDLAGALAGAAARRPLRPARARPTRPGATSSAPSCAGTVEHLRNVTSLAVWVPFNEGWGQFDAADVAAELAALDPTRSVDHASGWHDQGAGDLWSLHVYQRRVPGAPPRPRRAAGARADRVRRLRPDRPGPHLGARALRLPALRVRRRSLGEAFDRLHARSSLPPSPRAGRAPSTPSSATSRTR